MNQPLNPLFTGYLAELTSRAAILGPDAAREVVADITEHLTVAQDEVHSEADARAVLDRLGSPSDVVRAAAPEPVPAPTAPNTRLEAAALVMLWLSVPLVALPPAGTLLLIGGAIAVALAKHFSILQKVSAVLAIGLLGPVLVVAGLVSFGTATTICEGDVAGSSCTRIGPAWPENLAFGLLAIWIIAAIATTVWLVRTLRRVPAN